MIFYRKKVYIDEIPKLTLAQLRERETESDENPENIIELIREEIARRTYLIENLSELPVLELRKLEKIYYEEDETWHTEASRDYAPYKEYTGYRDEARETKKRISDEIEKRMKFLDNLAKLSMAELALSSFQLRKDITGK